MDKPYYQDTHVTIYHKDCREGLLQLDTSVGDGCITDPPYDIEADSLRDIWQKLARCMKLKSNLVWTFNTCRLQLIGQVLIPEFTELRTAVWHKPFCPSPWRFGWSWHWEPIIWWMRGDDKTGISKYKFDSPDVIPIDVIRPSDWQRTNHHDQKPDALWAQLIAWFTSDGDLLIEPFIGSGTTLYNAKKLNRRCIGYEIEEKYCEIAAKRCSQTVMELSC